MNLSRLLYGGTIFLGAFLLFLVEPMAAKQILPHLGGSSAVWITCLVFFQVVLFLGYLYAHWLTRITNQKTPAVVHSVLLLSAFVVAVLHFHPVPANAETWPVLAIFLGLGLAIGLPFLALSATSPLLQVWMAQSEGDKVPYRLFALSNLGSLLALGLYPSVIEPYVTLEDQWRLWRVGFLLYMLFCQSVAWRAGKSSIVTPAPAEQDPELLIPRGNYWLWFLLPAAASAQLAAVTAHLSQNIAAIPLLWIVPLAAYLLTFILAFEFPILYRRGIVIRLLVVFLGGLGYMLSKVYTGVPIIIGISFFLIELFLACYFCHSELYALRPRGVSKATTYYLLIVAGGAAGTCFVGIVSPLLFRFNYDVALSFLFVTVMALFVTWSSGWAQRLLWSAGTVMLCVLLGMLQVANNRNVLAGVRNFYGILRVKESHLPPIAITSRTLVNGSIEHGTEWFAPEFRDKPTTYYAEDSGIGLAMRFCCGEPTRKIGVIGLGTGTLAAYGKAGDNIQFYEINPLVERLARHFFTYMRNSQAKVSVIDGDARLSLVKEPPQNFSVLVVDAFSGDAIPVHLLTKEAMILYRRHLAANGIIAFHISNQYLDLAPVVLRLAESANMKAKVVHSSNNENRGEFSSTWVLVTNNETFWQEPEVQHAPVESHSVSKVRLWTDDYSSLLPILK